MKANCHFLTATLLFAMLGVAIDSSAQYSRPRNNYAPAPAPSTNQNRNATAKVPVEKPEQFKELKVNTTFFFAADKNKSFPRTKISETTAKSVKDGSVSTVPAASLVIAANKSTNSTNAVKK
jgi:hypothetical protein